MSRTKKIKRRRVYHTEIWEVDEDVKLEDIQTHNCIKFVSDYGKAAIISEGTQPHYCPYQSGGEWVCLAKQDKLHQNY